MDRLRQALKQTAMVLQQAVEGCDEFDAGGQVLAAARLVVEGEDILWCNEHKRPSPGGVVCTGWSETDGMEDIGPCRMVGRLLTERPQ